MFQQASDLREEGEELDQFLATLKPEDWDRETPFKSWTINQVVQHLHSADRAAVLTLTEPERFADLKKGMGLPKIVATGADLHAVWREYFFEMCDAHERYEPNHRVAWFGPDMSVRSCATARQMETWAHGQDIYDLLEVTRIPKARLRNIAHIGVSTFGWTFVNRGETPPAPPPYVCLDAPDGTQWEWNEPSDSDYVRGSALEFCHVVTQGRNVADTTLEYAGPAASAWMPIAQCFAGPPETPPAVGHRVFSSDE